MPGKHRAAGTAPTPSTDRLPSPTPTSGPHLATWLQAHRGIAPDTAHRLAPYAEVLRAHPSLLAQVRAADPSELDTLTRDRRLRQVYRAHALRAHRSYAAYTRFWGCVLAASIAGNLIAHTTSWQPTLIITAALALSGVAAVAALTIAALGIVAWPTPPEHAATDLARTAQLLTAPSDHAPGIRTQNNTTEPRVASGAAH